MLGNLLIVCKGYKKDGIQKKCSFVCDGDWGDPELEKHQKYHESLEDGKTYYWLGFGKMRSFGRYSERDGKE